MIDSGRAEDATVTVEAMPDTLAVSIMLEYEASQTIETCAAVFSTEDDMSMTFHLITGLIEAHISKQKISECLRSDKFLMVILESVVGPCVVMVTEDYQFLGDAMGACRLVNSLITRLRGRISVFMPYKEM